MNSQRPVNIVHKNDLGTYLGDWKNAMHFRYLTVSKRSPGEARRYRIVNIPTPFESFSFNSSDFAVILGFLNDRLEALEQAHISADQFDQFPHQSYAEARVFLKAFFFFFRVLLDDLSGILGYFHKVNEGIELPKSFADLQKKSEKGTLPDSLQQLLRPTSSWFPKMKDTRDDLVHYYDSLLLSFDRGNDGRNIVGHFSTKGRTSFVEADTRKHVGILLSESLLSKITQ